MKLHSDDETKIKVELVLSFWTAEVLKWQDNYVEIRPANLGTSRLPEYKVLHVLLRWSRMDAQEGNLVG